MPVRPDAPLRKVTLNLYEEDCVTLEKVYGHGWTAMVRDYAHNQAQAIRGVNHIQDGTRPRTLGDLSDD